MNKVRLHPHTHSGLNSQRMPKLSTKSAVPQPDGQDISFEDLIIFPNGHKCHWLNKKYL